MSEAPEPASVAPVAERSVASVPREVPPNIRTVLRKRFKSKKFQVSRLSSSVIVIIFMIEIILKLYTFHKELFHYKFELLDVIVVIACFSVNITVLFKGHFFEALQLMILFRLWRVAKIMNGKITSSTTHSERKLSKLKAVNHQLTMKIQQLEFNCSEKDQEIEKLKRLLREQELLE
ncbi:voltage-gated hydrogen channel 1-like isoform X2 [Sminthopsis crassicaudata]|uniref:voltage-gated hydrogen channel 1-like isoform X2 n=1 Tax=Sminthopsis crassicaudata TaxID=9301 RepID=UPI003D69696D